MYGQSTKMVALSTLLAFSTVVNGAAHLRPYHNAAAAELEVRDPQFGSFPGLNGLLSELGSFFGGLGATSTATSSSSVKPVASSTLKASSSSTSTVVALSSSAKASSVVSTSVAAVSTTSVASSGASQASSKISSSVVSASTKPASSAAPSSVKPVSSAVPSSPAPASSAVSSVASGKPVSSATGTAASSIAAASSVKPASSSGAAASSIKPASSSGAATSSAKPASSSGVAASSGKSASGTAVSASTAASSKVSASSNVKPASASSSGAVSACPGPRSSRSSGSVASGTASKSSKAASGSASSKSAVSSTGAVVTGTLSSKSAKASSSRVLTSSPTSSSTRTSVTGTPTGPSVTISAGTVVGSAIPLGVEQFLGIPYAQPPVGQLRLKPPVALTTGFGILNATTAPPSCPQFASNLTGNYSAGGLQPFINEFVFTPTVQQEDCLTISIYRPNTTTADSKLPVVYWIYGGGFEFGATAMYNGSNIVARSAALGAPIIFVEVNYRLGGFGFLAGADLAAEQSTNLGLRDQRLGLQWTADNIAAFGGDPSKVTLWGESAGAISSCYQLTVNGGDNTYNGGRLFRGSIHNSGSFAPADNVTAPQAQAIYDQVVSQAGCTASTAAERLACLRTVDFATLHNATNSVPVFGGYRSADLSYLPRPDRGDNFYFQSAEYAVAAGAWTKTPFIIGDQQDEGTILAIVQNNITTNDLLVEYIASWFPGDANAISDVQGLAALYPDNSTDGQPDGSPYDTGSNNNIYPQYKRLAAILGDIVFIITRRAFLNLGTGQGVKAWSYLATYLQGLATFGTLHGSDLAYLFDGLFVNTNPTTAIQTYYISFINNLDPNTINSTATAQNWPLWNSSAPLLADFTGGDVELMNDTFRSDVYEYLLEHVVGLRV